MASRYANLNDVNQFLPQDKLRVTQESLDLLSVDAERIIRGNVGGVIDATKLATWASPDTTPELVRSIAGRLIAAAYYTQRLSENATDVPEYAQMLYNVAMGYLAGIKSGSQVIVEIDGTTIDVAQTALTSDNFRPNDLSTPPAFTREQIFG